MLDRALFHLINAAHAPFWDAVMIYISRRESWVSAYAVLILALIHLYRRRAALLLPLLVATVGAADYISSSGFKPWLKRLRPCHDPLLADSVRLVAEYGCGGRYGFMSSHAANTMALAAFLTLVLPRRFVLFKWGLGLWVLLTGYSRVYLAAHYPGDILAGWVLGGVLGWGGALLYTALTRRDAAAPIA